MPDPKITIRGNADLGPISVGLRQVVAGAGKMAAGVGAAAAAGTAALAKEFGEQEKLTDRLAASLGANAKEQGRLGKLAGSLYADAYGEEMGDVTSAIEAVRSSFRDLGTGPELEKVTAQALDFASIFEVDVPRAVSVAQTVVKSGLAKDATEALDLLTVSAQRVPAALRENVLDAADEYGQFFASIGYDGEQAFSALVKASAQGEFGIDKLGDAVKEFTIRSTDMSTASTDAYGAIGVDAQKAADDVLAGGKRARGATDRILEGLLKLPPGAEQANAAIALFGTPLEDLNVTKIPAFLRALQDGQKGLGDFEGAIDRAGATLNDNAASRLTSFKREIEQTFVNVVGGKVLPIVDDLVDQLQQDYSSGGLRGAIGGVADEIEGLTGFDVGPILADVEDGIGSVVRIAEKLGPAFVDAAQSLTPILSPLGLIADGLGVIADVIDLVPDGLVSLAFQAGAVALVLPRLATAARAAGLSMLSAGAHTIGFAQSLTRANLAAAARGMGALGGAAKTAAGIGGILALTNSADESNGALKTLSNVGGGALLGFSVGGPVGAAIGGSIGLLKSLADQAGITGRELKLSTEFQAAGEGFLDAKQDADALRESLMGVVHAYGETTRAAVEASFLGDDGKIDSDIAKLRELGVSMDTIVSATLGQGDAQRKVNEALAGYVNPLRSNAEQTRRAYEDAGDGIREVYDSAGRLTQVQLSNDEVEQYGRAYDDAATALRMAEGVQTRFGERVVLNTGALREHKQTVQQLAGDLGVTVKQYQRFPKTVRTKVEKGGLPQTSADAIRLIGQYKQLQSFGRIKAVVSAPGVDLTMKQVGQLTKRYGLTPKQVRTLIRTEGIDASTKDVQKVLKQLGALERVEPKVDGPRRGVERGVRDAESVAKRGGEDIRRAVEQPIKDTKGDLGALRQSIPPQLTAVQGPARAGGVQIGAALKGGIISGFAGTATTLANQARSAVAGAVRAGREAGDINSPSRETEYIGRMLGEGLAVGLDKSAAGVVAKAGGLVAQIRKALGGVTGGSEGITGVVEKLGGLIESTYEAREKAAERAAAAELRAEKARLRERLKGEKLDKAIRAAERESEQALNRRLKAIRQASGATAKLLREESAGLRANGKLQDANTARLSAAADRLKQLKAESKSYAATIRESFVGYGNVIGLGQLEDGSVAGAALLDQLEDRAVRAERFAALIASFRDRRGPKLSEAAVQQLLDAGPDAALATAEAIAAGGAEAVNEINALQARIAKAGGGLGASMSKEFKQAGINAAAGLVAGLEREQKRLDRVAIKIGDRLADAIRKALGIKSPSRVFRGVGKQTMAGLAIGLDDTRVQKIMRRTAADMAAPFARDAFKVSAAGSSTTGASGGYFTVDVRLSAEQMNALQNAGRVNVAVNVGRAAGARVLAVGG